MLLATDVIKADLVSLDFLKWSMRYLSIVSLLPTVDGSWHKNHYQLYTIFTALSVRELKL